MNSHDHVSCSQQHSSATLKTMMSTHCKTIRRVTCLPGCRHAKISPAERQRPASASPAHSIVEPDERFHSERGSTIADPASVSEFGRTYHGYKDGTYLLPNDATEQDRLDMQHVAWNAMMDGALAWAPFREQPPRSVLDVGTGTGIWAIEFADRNPGAVVVGTDLSCIQPWGVHPRVHWVQEDAEDDWAGFEGENVGGLELPFDYIHLRMMVTCFKDHRDVIAKVYDHLRPGGWVEYQEGGLDLWCEDTSTLGTAVHKWTFLMKAGAIALGRDLEVAQKYRLWLAQAGFVDVQEKVILAPGSPWPRDKRLKHQGKWMRATALQGIEALSLKILHHGLGMAIEEVDKLVIQMRKDVDNEDIHFYWTW